MAKEMNKLFILLFSFVVLHIHVQGFDLVLIASEVQEMSSEYFDPENTFLYIDVDKEPPTLISNITVIKVVPERATFGFSALGYSMGEYRIPVGMEYASPICEVYNETLILGPAIKALGFIGECPPPPGTYANSGYVPDTTLFPEQFPRNQYEITLEIKLDDKPILITKTYMEIL